MWTHHWSDYYISKVKEPDFSTYDMEKEILGLGLM